MADPTLEFFNAYAGLILASFGIVGGIYAGSKFLYRVVSGMIRKLAHAEAESVVQAALRSHLSLDELPRREHLDKKLGKIEKRLGEGDDVIGALREHAETSIKLHRITLLILDSKFPGVAEGLRVNNSDVWKEVIEPYRNGNGGHHDDAEGYLDRIVARREGKTHIRPRDKPAGDDGDAS